MLINLEIKRFWLSPATEFQENANIGIVNKINCLHKLFAYLYPKVGPVFNAVICQRKQFKYTKKQRTKSGVTTYVIAWMLQIRSMAPSLIYTVSFCFRKIIQISVCKN